MSPLRVPDDPDARAMLAIGGGVGLAAGLAPTLFQRAFGIPPDEIRGAGQLGWRLFAARNLYLTARALTGHPDGLAAYGPLQALDQLVFWHAYATRSVPRPTALAAATASGVIIALDARRRRKSSPANLG